MPKTLKRGDTYPPITGVVTDEQGPVPLGTARSVKLLLRNDRRLIECPVTVVDPAAGRGAPGCGKWSYDWQDGDTDFPGTYQAEMEVTWDDATDPPQVETFPNDAAANETVTIADDLNPEA